MQLGTLNISLFDSLHNAFRNIWVPFGFMATCAGKTTTIKLKFYWAV